MKAVVVGSAHLDVLATVTGDDLALDKIGRVGIDVGGTGANIAVNLKACGAEVVMLTVMNDSPFSRIVREFMESHGVEMAVNTFAGPDAVFSAHVGKDGDMISAISSMPVGDASFETDTVYSLLADADCLVLDCNVSAAELDRIVGIANGMLVPVFVAAVSEEKSLRINAIGGKLDGIFMNRKEAAYYRAHHLRGAASYEDMARELRAPLVVTLGPEGAVVADPEKSVSIPPPAVRGVANLLGAGDAFMAATVFHHIKTHRPLHEAASAGARLAAEVMRLANCNTGKAGAVTEIMEDLEYRASRDALTGLLTRGHAEREAREVIEASAIGNRPASVIIIDIDHFKKVNDQYGHDAGDDVIRSVSEIIRAGIRETDIAARWGGEEFVIVLPGATVSAALVVAERIRGLVEAALKERGVTVSAGVAILTEDIADLADMLKKADEMLYIAKNAGRNRVVA